MKLGVAKSGAIAVSPVVELLLDERADRENIDVTVTGSGAKMGPKDVERAVEDLLEEGGLDAAVFISPNLTADGPQRAAEILGESDVPALLVGDGPSKDATEDLEDRGLGYVIVTGDPMIGARREFLDPAEMAFFNGQVITLLSCTGALTAVQNALDDVVESGGEELPRTVIDRGTAVEAANFENPYARSKAMAAYEMAEKVADLDVEGCFMVHEMESYVPIVAAAHEMVRKAAQLADEARELEKTNDSVSRTPHAADGITLSKTRLMEKPQ